MTYFALVHEMVLCLGIDERRDVMVTALVLWLDQAEGALERERMDSTNSKVNEASTAYLARKDLPWSARRECPVAKAESSREAADDPEASNP
jgi:hypothetical protein